MGFQGPLRDLPDLIKYQTSDGRCDDKKQL